MDRRTFLGAASAAAITTGLHPSRLAEPDPPKLKPMALGLLVSPLVDPKRPSSAFTTWVSAIAFSRSTATSTSSRPMPRRRSADLLGKYQLVATTVEVVGPGPLEWNFLQGPSTIGLVPPKTRAARIDALRQVSDFAKLLGIGQVQTHCGFIPEDPTDALYPQAVAAIRTVAEHCHGNGQYFLMETGQETPTTMSRMIRDVNLPNLAVGLDTANLILYGKANPVDAVDIIGTHVRSVHAKDGSGRRTRANSAKKCSSAQGLVDFKTVFTKLHKLGYTGAITIERETSGPQQIEDVKNEKMYLQRILDEVLA